MSVWVRVNDWFMALKAANERDAVFNKTISVTLNL